MQETFTHKKTNSKLRTHEKTEEAEMVEISLAAEEAFTEGFEHLASIKEALNHIMVSPSQHAVDKILNYSKSTSK